MDKPITVKELNCIVKNQIESLGVLWIKGEVSNLKAAMSGHYYFTLKDEEAAVQVALFKYYAATLDFKLKEGQQVLVRGKVSIYEKTGSYQLYAQNIEEYGLGNIHLKIERLKEKLRKEGLFEASRKKPLPAKIERIGIVTSSKGAVLHDIQKVVRSRNKFVELILWPVSVQGADAPGEITRGIEKFNDYGLVDILIIGRGGGSFEDLMPFNDEKVVRAIADSGIPVISAVGHETDNPLSDYAADIRGATPSQAAELATENIEDRYRWLKVRFIANFGRYQGRLNNCYQDLDMKLEKLKDYLNKSKAYKKNLIENYRMLEKAFLGKLEGEKLRLRHLGEKLHLVSPLAILGKGYSIIFDKDDRIIRSSKDIELDEQVNVKLSDGRLICKVVGKD